MSDKKAIAPAEGSRERQLGRPAGTTVHMRSQDLFGAAQEVVIEHNDRAYRLRITAQGKLILTA